MRLAHYVNRLLPQIKSDIWDSVQGGRPVHGEEKEKRHLLAFSPQ